MSERRYKNNYQYGTEAPKYPYETHSTPVGKPKGKPKQRPDYAFYIWMSIWGGIIFCAAGAFVYQSSLLSMKQTEIKTINEEIRKTKSNISSVEAIVATHLDLEYIQEMAVEQLEMAEPLPHQIVYIQLSEESYTVYNE